MLRLIKYFLLGLVLLLVCFASALLAMRFAIHGREVRVPKFIGLKPVDAERIANTEGLVLTFESRFYSSEVPEGCIVSQSPVPDTKVRRGWKVRVAESLGPQRASIPNVVGQSERVAELNITRRGLEIGSVATIHFPGPPPATVVAQSPAAGAKNAVSPKINLIVSASDNVESYVMPNFVGQPLSVATSTLEKAGFVLGDVVTVDDLSGPSGNIVKQSPAAGTKISAGETINLQVRR